MKISRRDFARLGLATISATALRAQEHHHHTFSGVQPVMRPILRASELRPFVDALAIPKVLATRQSRPLPGSSIEAPFYRVEMREIHTKVHRDMPATRFWSFGDSFPGPSIEVNKGRPVQIEWVNRLPAKHFLPIDHSLHGADASLPEVRAVVHVHGAKVSPDNDGYPEEWYTPGKSQTCFYPNEQDAALLWYHDHTMGINRLNVFAGLLGTYIIRDEIEKSLHLPAGELEIPLTFCDRTFDKQGQLNYPVSNLPEAPWVPEFEGDALLLNGNLFPFLNVKPASYRLRILNASNARFLNLTLDNGQEFTQIGSDQGLLATPVRTTRLSLAPAERADVLLDFVESRGAKIALMNDVLPVMEFRVDRTVASSKFAMPNTLRDIPRIPEREAIKTRVLSLDEVLDDFGEVQASLLNNQHWHDPVTESPELNTTEIWSFANTTEDTHPIHLHLVRFQVLDRQPFDTYEYQLSGEIKFTGPSQEPEPGEMGWKDTVRAFGGMVTRIITRFEGYTGRYVWHCHILEHEDNDMMRPFVVVGPR